MAKASSRDHRRESGLERLRARGLDPLSASAEELGAASDDPDTALAVASILGERPSDESVVWLRRLESVATDKEVRREARRALYRLKQRGIDVPETPRAETPAAPSPFAGAAPEGYLSPPDPLGDRLLWLVKPRSGGGLLHLTTVVNEPGGLREAVLVEVTRKSLKSLRDDLTKRHGVRLVEVDWRYVDWINHEGYERARARDELPEAAAAYPQLRMQLFRSPAEPAAAPIESVLGVGDPDPADVAASAELFAEPDLQYWFLPEAVLASWLERYASLRDSPIVLDRQSQIERVEELLRDATATLFAGEASSSWRRRLEELAWFLWGAGRRDAARRARAAALAIGASPSGGTGVPFFEELVRRSFGLFFARDAEREREERASSVLVTPDQLREEQARSRGARTPGPPRIKPR